MESDDSMSKLKVAEQEILYLLKVAEETTKELEKAPHCNHEKIETLSKAYQKLVLSINSSLKDSSTILVTSESIKDEQK
jgi:RNase P subunit RPR2